MLAIAICLWHAAVDDGTVVTSIEHGAEATQVKDNHGDTPLHWLCRFGPTMQGVEFLCQTFPSAVRTYSASFGFSLLPCERGRCDVFNLNGSGGSIWLNRVVFRWGDTITV